MIGTVGKQTQILRGSYFTGYRAIGTHLWSNNIFESYITRHVTDFKLRNIFHKKIFTGVRSFSSLSYKKENTPRGNVDFVTCIDVPKNARFLAFNFEYHSHLMQQHTFFVRASQLFTPGSSLPSKLAS